MLSNIMFTCPPIRSVIAGPLPLYGTCVMSRPSICLNISQDMWIVEPLPLEAQVSLPGCALASAMSSCTEFAFTPGFSTSTLANEAKTMTGTRSLFGS